MASGKPVLGAISCEGKSLIEDSNCGLVCEAEDYKTLSDMAIKMSEMSVDDRNKLGMNGLNYFNDNFDRKILLRKITDLLLDDFEER